MRQTKTASGERTINSLTSDGTTAMIYDFDLEVPSNGNCYRIDFYKDSGALVAGGDLNLPGHSPYSSERGSNNVSHHFWI